ncbi:hypothetical protein NEFER03_1904 [Nematocida sp. LUAm3]|nr:hypothetical protein NEFER03_1904 [Nematocida sp. LUAm3]KAI5173945.1 hypothetical protein NEFER02_0412 [Nematocida sp. LUAm2]KAI5177310.1 hypothetical protein NEFER01_0585 [Nematocida sp. LUAm1]
MIRSKNSSRFFCKYTKQKTIVSILMILTLLSLVVATGNEESQSNESASSLDRETISKNSFLKEEEENPLLTLVANENLFHLINMKAFFDKDEKAFFMDENDPSNKNSLKHISFLFENIKTFFVEYKSFSEKKNAFLVDEQKFFTEMKGLEAKIESSFTEVKAHFTMIKEHFRIIKIFFTRAQFFYCYKTLFSKNGKKESSTDKMTFLNEFYTWIKEDESVINSLKYTLLEMKENYRKEKIDILKKIEIYLNDNGKFFKARIAYLDKNKTFPNKKKALSSSLKEEDSFC